MAFLFFFPKRKNKQDPSQALIPSVLVNDSFWIPKQVLGMEKDRFNFSLITSFYR